MERKKKVAMLGFFHNHSTIAPYWDDEYEIWGVNTKGDKVLRYDRWFEFHTMYNIKYRDRKGKYYKWLKKCEVPVYMKKHYKAIPNSVEYPIHEMIEEFGPIFNNSFDYMLALAIKEQFEEIYMFGVAFASIHEYLRERLSYARLIGIAEGRGIKVWQSYNIFRMQYMYCYPEIDIEDYWTEEV